jgi:hypothetical protein
VGETAIANECYSTRRKQIGNEFPSIKGFVSHSYLPC